MRNSLSVEVREYEWEHLSLSLQGIIPDENYEDFLNLVNAQTEVIQQIVGKYSMPFYVDFLKFIMRHIIQIWKSDYDLAMANSNQHHTVKPYEPERIVDKLVAIFKQLIFRLANEKLHFWWRWLSIFLY